MYSIKANGNIPPVPRPRPYDSKLFIFITLLQRTTIYAPTHCRWCDAMHIADKLSIHRFFGGEWQPHMIAGGVYMLCVWKHHHSNAHTRQFTFKCISINFIVSRSIVNRSYFIIGRWDSWCWCLCVSVSAGPFKRPKTISLACVRRARRIK